MVKVAPLVHIDKLTYLSPFIAICHHARLQEILSWMKRFIWKVQLESCVVAYRTLEVKYQK